MGNKPNECWLKAVALEKVAEMDIIILELNPQVSMWQYVLDKHYMRKYGLNAYYD